MTKKTLAFTIITLSLFFIAKTSRAECPPLNNIKTYQTADDNRQIWCGLDATEKSVYYVIYSEDPADPPVCQILPDNETRYDSVCNDMAIANGEPIEIDQEEFERAIFHGETPPMEPVGGDDGDGDGGGDGGGGGSLDGGGGNTKYKPEVPIPFINGEDPTGEGITGYIDGVYKFVTIIIGILGAMMFMIGGFQYMTSAGNTAAAGEAKNTMIAALAGTIIVVTAYLLLRLINRELVDLQEPVGLIEILIP